MTQIEYAYELEERLRALLGNDELLESLIRALSVDELIDNFHYIARCYDVDISDIQEKL